MAVAAAGRDVVLYASGFVDAVAGCESDNVGTRDRLGTHGLESGLGLVDDLEASQARVIDRMNPTLNLDDVEHGFAAAIDTTLQARIKMKAHATSRNIEAAIAN
ncbi:hypothetical protein NL676_022252 [Syzygium grande]|nr:hypothetical protein NL676_022252 [Syzygium grande]